jgi:multidrug efflux system outer membrane protein
MFKPRINGTPFAIGGKHACVLAALTLALALAGCVQLPILKQPAPDLPKAWPAVAEKGVDLAAEAWWTAYADPALNALITEALANNSDIKLAAARIEEARAGVGLSDADRYPGVNAQASAGRNQVSERGVNPVPGSRINSNYKASFQAAYELDLWGRYRAASEAARADLLASEYAAQVVRASLAAQVARAYFALTALDAQRRLAEDTLGNRREAVALQALRLESGMASELELHQAEAELAGVEVSLANLARQVRQQELALAVLIGWEPKRIVETVVARGASTIAILPPAVPAGLPADLLLRRPDLRQTEQALLAAQARIRETRAALFPDLSLTASLGSESKSLSDLFSGGAGVWGLTASVVQSIFNAGRTEAAVQVTAARQEQLLASYEKSVRNAFREVLDALVTHRQAREVGEAETRRAAAYGKAAELAALRHENGLTSYLEVLDARRNLFQAQINGIEARRAQLSAVSDLALALGGGWRTAP